MRRLQVAIVLLVPTACGGVLADGESQFRKGRYAEAKQAFASHEADYRAFGETERAEYSLYRGLTLSALGDYAQARLWLREAKAIEDAHPGSLSGSDARRLEAGIDANDVTP
jgi:tetratricopeptide (TPR) repeat protein